MFKKLVENNIFMQWRKMSPMARSEARAFYISISPWLFGFLFFLSWPMVRSLYLAFTNYRVLNEPRFTGFENVERLINDELFWQSMRVTVIYVAGSVPIGSAIALGVALLLSQKLIGVNIWRTIFFLPSIVSGVAVAVMWSFVFNPDFGLINVGLRWAGIDGPGWITSSSWALPALIIMSWWSIGGQMIIYLAGLKGIPKVLYEAAVIDGAGTWSCFRYVTIPMLSPTIFFNFVVGLIGAFQSFDAAYVLTNGGPNNATLTYMLYLYRNAFQFVNMGYASLLAWILFLIILGFTLLVMRSATYWVYYETDMRR